LESVESFENALVLDFEFGGTFGEKGLYTRTDFRKVQEIGTLCEAPS